jgi:hypothetical protein
MAYLGAAPQPGISFSGVQTQSFNGNGSAVEFALSRHVAQATNLEVIVNNVQQSPFDGSYSVVGGYTLTFSEAPSTGTNNIYVVYRDYSVETVIDTGAVRKSGDTITGPVVINSTAHDQFRVTDGTRSLYVDTDTNGVALASGPGQTGPGVYLFSTEGSVNLFTNNTLRVKVDSAGRMTNAFQPSLGVYMSSTQSIASGVRTKVAFNTIDFQRGSNYNTSTYRFTAPIEGVYLIQAHLYIYTVNQAEVHIFKNGSLFIRSAGTQVASTNPNGAQVNHILNLAAGDYVEIYGEQSNGNTQTIYTGGGRDSYLTIAMLY